MSAGLRSAAIAAVVVCLIWAFVRPAGRRGKGANPEAPRVSSPTLPPPTLPPPSPSVFPSSSSPLPPAVAASPLSSPPVVATAAGLAKFELPLFARSVKAPPAVHPSNHFTGTYVDRSSGTAARILVAPSGVAYARRLCWVPEEGSASSDRLLMFSLSARLAGTELRWSNGVVWDKVSSDVADVEVMQRTPLQPLPGACPGRDPKAYTSKTEKPFYLCTHGSADLVSRDFIRLGWWNDCLLLPMLVRLLRQVYPGVQIEAVDVGGNIGTCSMVMASEGVNVTTFEPAPINYKLVEKSIELNAGRFPAGGRVTLHRAGAGKEKMAAVVQNEEGNLGNGIVQKKKADLGHLYRQGWKPRFVDSTIHITRLDDEVHHHVHLMKMDCQGHEIEVLLGARVLMTQHGVDIIRTEFNAALLKNSGHEPVKLLQLFHEYGYTVVVDAQLLPPTEFDTFVAKHQVGEVEVFAIDTKVIGKENWSCLR